MIINDNIFTNKILLLPHISKVIGVWNVTNKPHLTRNILKLGDNKL